MLRVIFATLIAAATIAPSSAAQEQPHQARPRLGIDLHESFGGANGIGGRVSVAHWGVLVRYTDLDQSEERFRIRSQEDSSAPFSDLQETAVLVEGALRIAPRQTITFAGGLARWSGQVAGGPGRLSCVSGWLGRTCANRYRVETFDPRWRPAGELSYHVTIREDAWLLGRLIIGARLSPHSSLSGFYFGVGSGRVGR